VANRNVANFLEQFALPLVAGGQLRIGSPITPAELTTMGVELDQSALQSTAVDDAREAVLSVHLAQPPRLLLEAEDLSLLAALHNALFLAHPDANLRLVSQRGRRRVIDASLTMASIPMTSHRQRVLGRYALFHHLFGISRRDISLTWWTGSARFTGQQPPARLTRWSQLRRVQRQEEIAGFADLLAGDDTAPIIATLARRIPLLQLMHFSQGAPPLHWEDAAFVLRDASLARVVIHQLAETRGEAKLWRATAAFEQMLERTPPAADVLAVSAGLVYAEMLLCIEEARGASSADRSPQMVKALGTSDAGGQRALGAATFFALPSALAQAYPALAVPPGLMQLPSAWTRWQRRRAQAVAALGDTIVDSLVARLRRHLGGASDAARSIMI
jgi:hypothetical protein